MSIFSAQRRSQDDQRVLGFDSCYRNSREGAVLFQIFDFEIDISWEWWFKQKWCLVLHVICYLNYFYVSSLLLWGLSFAIFLWFSYKCFETENFWKLIFWIYLFLSISYWIFQSGRNAHYKLTSTIMLWLQTSKTSSGVMNLGGSLTRQVWNIVFLSIVVFGERVPSPQVGIHSSHFNFEFENIYESFFLAFCAHVLSVIFC